MCAFAAASHRGGGGLSAGPAWRPRPGTVPSRLVMGLNACDVGWCGSDSGVRSVGWDRVAGLHPCPASSERRVFAGPDLARGCAVLACVNVSQSRPFTRGEFRFLVRELINRVFSWS